MTPDKAEPITPKPMRRDLFDEYAAIPQVPAPDLAYRPQWPANFRPGIGLIGCGGITADHLTAYRNAGFNVVALCDLDLERARNRQQEFFPEARVYDDYRLLLKRDDIAVVDIATHPPVRGPIIEAAIAAGKHVLSQKPFVLDLDQGQRLVDLADLRGVRLAVNQNGRWAPHFSFARAAIQAGLIGEVIGSHLSVHWDHSWVEGSEFENVKHLILYDYAIHWFDMVNNFMHPKTPRRVFASMARAPGQTVRPALLGQALIEFDEAQATVSFDAFCQYGQQDRTFVAGTQGSISSVGPGNKVQRLTLTTTAGAAVPDLQGSWFPDAFGGTMGELLLAIEQNREPSIGAARNLNSLALCFAAVMSAETGMPVVPGSVRKLPG